MSAITKVISLGVSKGKLATQEIVACRNLPKDICSGVKEARNIARTNNYSIFKSLKTQGGAIARGTNKHLPGLFAILGTPLPIPLSSFAGFSLGKFLQKLLLKLL
jgi:hypothetical protein